MNAETRTLLVAAKDRAIAGDRRGAADLMLAAYISEVPDRLEAQPAPPPSDEPRVLGRKTHDAPPQAHNPVLALSLSDVCSLLQATRSEPVAEEPEEPAKRIEEPTAVMTTLDAARLRRSHAANR